MDEPLASRYYNEGERGSNLPTLGDRVKQFLDIIPNPHINKTPTPNARQDNLNSLAPKDRPDIREKFTKYQLKVHTPVNTYNSSFEHEESHTLV